jgi:hypothetical protein
MANFVISDLFLDGDFCEPLTQEELESNVFGGATGAGSVSAGEFYQKDGVIKENAVTATVASSSSQPFKIGLSYSFEPRLSVSAGVYRT